MANSILTTLTKICRIIQTNRKSKKNLTYRLSAWSRFRVKNLKRIRIALINKTQFQVTLLTITSMLGSTYANSDCTPNPPTDQIGQVLFAINPDAYVSEQCISTLTKKNEIINLNNQYGKEEIGDAVFRNLWPDNNNFPHVKTIEFGAKTLQQVMNTKIIKPTERSVIPTAKGYTSVSSSSN